MLKFSFFIFVLIFTACGGRNSSSSDTPTTQPPLVVVELEPLPQSDSFAKYSGLKTKALVDADDGHDIAFYIAELADIAHVLAFANDFKEVRFDTLMNHYPDLEIEDCESGEYAVGEAENDSIPFVYEQCVIGPYLLNGYGSAVPGYDANGEIVAAVLTFDDMEVSNQNNNYTLEGKVEYFYGDFSSALNLGNVRYNTLLTNKDTEEQFYLYNFQLGQFNSLDYEIEGTVFFSEYGYASVNTINGATIDDQIQSALVLSIEGQSTLALSHTGNEYIGLGRFSSAQDITDELNQIPFSFLYNQDYKNSTNRAPLALAQLSENELNKDTELTLNGNESSDLDYDLLTYNWSIVSGPENADVIITDNGYALANATFSTAGDYQLSLVVNDGESTSVPYLVDLYVRQNAPNIELSNTVSELVLAETYQSQILNNSPSDDGPISYSLHYAPSSMELTENNEIYWDGLIPRIGGEVEVNFAVKASNKDNSVILEHRITLNDTNASPIFTADFFKTEVRGLIDFDQDGVNELLILKGQMLQIFDLEAGDLIWSADIPYLNYIQYIGYNEETKKIYIYNNRQELFELETSTKSISTIWGEKINGSNAFSGTFKVININGDIYGLSNNKITNISNGEARDSIDYIITSGDLNGDSQEDYLVNAGIYQVSNNLLLGRFEVEYFYIEQAQFQNIDSDAGDELVIWGKTNDAAPYTLDIYDYTNGELVLVQSLPGLDQLLSFHVNEESIYTIQQLNHVVTYSRNEQGVYTMASNQKIEDFNLDYNSYPAFGSLIFNPCRINEESNGNIYLSCTGYENDSNDYVSFYASVDINKSPSTLNPILEINSEYNTFGNIILDEEGGFSVGQYYGVMKIDENLNQEQVNANLTDIEYNERPNFVIHDKEGADFTTWQTEGNELKKTLLSSLDVSYLEIPYRSFNPSFERFSVNNQNFVLVNENQHVSVFTEDNITEVFYKRTDDGIYDVSDIHAIQTFTYDEQTYTAVWRNRDLLILKFENGNFEEYQVLELPLESSETYNSDLKLLTYFNHQNDLFLVVMEDGSKENEGLYTNNYLHILYSMKENKFTVNSTDTERVFVNSNSSGSDFCVSNSINSKRSIAYFMSAAIDVEDEYIDAELERPQKLVALDLMSGERVWSSKELEQENRPISTKSFIQCVNNGQLQQRLIYTRSKKLSVTP
ncbi:MAG: hypothetical protein ABJK64_07215 [Paraglaciecola sp.]|uniref:hypothetical protein n=1 Tax=Paraglaciecola sp. TaxID=1920173 RepID=UPI0032970EC3